MAYILHLETSTKVCSVALSLNGNLKQLVESNDLAYSHGEKLTLFIEQVLKREGITATNLDAVSVASGPGSYTGLRIGVSTAKGLCFALSIPLIAIDSLLSLYEIAAFDHPSKTIIPVIDARRMEVFSAVYGPNRQLMTGIAATVVDETTFDSFLPFVSCGDGAEKLKEIWKNRAIEFDLEVQSSAKGQVKLAFEMFEKQNFEDVAYFEPFYLKDFIAGTPKPIQI